MTKWDYDVVVVGAGVIGCAIAFELSHTGRRVLLVDQRQPGGGASFASAGVLAPYVEGHASPVLRALGRRSLALYPSWLDRVARAAGSAVPFRQAGTLETAASPADVARLAQSKSTADAEGVAATWLDARAAHEAEPHLGNHVLGALRIPLHAAVDVPALTATAAAAAETLGAVVAARSPAERIAEDAGGIAVSTSTRTYRAPVVVVASGAWAPQLVPSVTSALPIRPIRGQLVRLAAPRVGLTHILWSADVYLVPWSDGTVLVGATSEDVGFDERTTAAGVAGLVTRATALVPALAEATFVDARQGLRPASPDELPFVGWSATLPGLLYACGHYRNGALLAPLTATLVGALVAGDSSDDALPHLAPARAGRL